MEETTKTTPAEETVAQTSEAEAAAETPATEEAAPEKKEKKEKKVKQELAKALEENKRLTEAVAEGQDKYLRLAAEYDNFRRRTAQEKAGIYTDALGDVMKEILPLLDNLERAAMYTEAEKVAEGLGMMNKAVEAMLQKLGVEAYGAVGEPFDPEIHSAVLHAEDGSFGENVIMEVFQRGYRRGDRILRFAMVKVAN